MEDHGLLLSPQEPEELQQLGILQFFLGGIGRCHPTLVTPESTPVTVLHSPPSVGPPMSEISNTSSHWASPRHAPSLSKPQSKPQPQQSQQSQQSQQLPSYDTGENCSIRSGDDNDSHGGGDKDDNDDDDKENQLILARRLVCDLGTQVQELGHKTTQLELELQAKSAENDAL
jgi:hypothetical protein